VYNVLIAYPKTSWEGKGRMGKESVEVELPAGTILNLTGIHIELMTPTRIRATVGNWELLNNWGVIRWSECKEDKTPIEWEERY
jgi:hypothetical protein